MRRAILAALVLNAIMLAIRVTQEATAQVAAPPGTGDANGDGEIDISDPLYLLRYLFEAGAPPAACAAPHDLVDRVSDLESQVSELSAGQASLNLTATRVPLTASGFAFDARFEYACTYEERFQFKAGTGRFPEAEPGTVQLRGGELRDGEILFETNRQADLLLELDYVSLGYWPNGSAIVRILLDGEDVWAMPSSSSSSGPPPAWETGHKLVYEIPSGTHVLSVEGGLSCGSDNAMYRAIAQIRYLAVHYMD
jgi:hypothetical protein